VLVRRDKPGFMPLYSLFLKEQYECVQKITEAVAQPKTTLCLSVYLRVLISARRRRSKNQPRRRGSNMEQVRGKRQLHPVAAVVHGDHKSTTLAPSRLTRRRTTGIAAAAWADPAGRWMAMVTPLVIATSSAGSRASTSSAANWSKR
jgi:hypothetical protein